MLEKNKVYCGDCLELMKEIEDKSINMILCDLPYGVTQNPKDNIINLEKLWSEYKRIIKDKGTIVLTAQQSFTTDLINSNREMFKYELIWDKQLTSGFLNANRQPLRVHENILVFYKKLGIYNPQKVKGEKSHSKGFMKSEKNQNYGEYGKEDNTEILGEMKHPKSIISFMKPHPSKANHPTQKPVELGRYLIRTYTNEGDLVLDNTCGVGSFPLSAKLEKRDFIGIEISEEYCKIAEERIKKVSNQQTLNFKEVKVRC